MAISIDWSERIIYVPKDDLTHVSGLIYELNVEEFRHWVIDLLDDNDGIVNPDIINHNTVVVLGGVAYARAIEIINGYTVTFEDGQYAVNLVGANTNLADVTNVNQVSVRPNNSAGLVDNTYGKELEDTEKPTWISSIGISDIYQDGNSIRISWNAAKDNSDNPVNYNIYLSREVDTLFSSSSLIQTVQGNSSSTRFEDTENTLLESGVTYFCGVRAIDDANNETDNTNYMSIEYVIGSISDVDVNIVSVNGTPVESIEDFKANEVDIDLSGIPQSVWEYVTRELTVAAGLTEEQEQKLDKIISDIQEINTNNWSVSL